MNQYLNLFVKLNLVHKILQPATWISDLNKQMLIRTNLCNFDQRFYNLFFFISTICFSLEKKKELFAYKMVTVHPVMSY